MISKADDASGAGQPTSGPEEALLLCWLVEANAGVVTARFTANRGVSLAGIARMHEVLFWPQLTVRRVKVPLCRAPCLQP